MLFVIKRNVAASLVLLLILSGIALGLRTSLPNVPSLKLTSENVQQGLLLFAVVLLSDGLIHGTLWVGTGQWYRERHRDLAATFRDQSLLAILCGSLLAGVGEELVFRGLSREPYYLLPSALVFGLLHHIRASFRLFTIWSVWEGVLFAIGLYWTGSVVVTMIAHFLHDLMGFLLFRYLNRS